MTIAQNVKPLRKSEFLTRCFFAYKILENNIWSVLLSVKHLVQDDYKLWEPCEIFEALKLILCEVFQFCNHPNISRLGGKLAKLIIILQNLPWKTTPRNFKYFRFFHGTTINKFSLGFVSKFLCLIFPSKKGPN